MLTDGTGNPDWAAESRSAKLLRRWMCEEDTMTWRHELHPEILDVFAETDPVKLWTGLRDARLTMDAWITDLEQRIAAAQAKGEIGTVKCE